jgi:hypothetical protein
VWIFGSEITLRKIQNFRVQRRIAECGCLVILGVFQWLFAMTVRRFIGFIFESMRKLPEHRGGDFPRRA